MTHYRVRKSRRKTMAIHILSDGQVEVRAPLRTPQAILDRFVMEKAQWIEAASTEARKRYKKRQEFTLKDGCSLFYLGKDCRWYAVNSKNPFLTGSVFIYLKDLQRKR